MQRAISRAREHDAPLLAKRVVRLHPWTRFGLVELGLIERAPDQRIAVAWDTITAEMKLAA